MCAKSMHEQSVGIGNALASVSKVKALHSNQFERLHAIQINCWGCVHPKGINSELPPSAKCIRDQFASIK